MTCGSGQHGQLGHANGFDQLRFKTVDALSSVEVAETTAGSTLTASVTSEPQPVARVRATAR
jgi:hypothetical protein